MLTAQSLREMPDAEVQDALSKMSKKQIEASTERVQVLG